MTHVKEKDCPLCKGDGIDWRELDSYNNNSRTNNAKKICEECAEILTKYHGYSLEGYHANIERYANKFESKGGEAVRLDAGYGSKNRYFGIELETEADMNQAYLHKWDCREDWRDEFCFESGLQQFFKMENDGSLDYGIEFVSNPMTLEVFKETSIIKTLTTSLRVQGSISEYSPRCGLHVHMSRAGLTENIVAAMRLIINENADWFMKFGRRSTLYGTKDVKKGKSWKDYIKSSGNGDRSNCRYEMLNCSTKQTVEFRFFRGTLNHERILAAIELCDAMAEFCVQNFSEGTEFKNADLMGVVGLICYIRRNKKKYKTLVEYIKSKDLDSLRLL